MCLTIINISEEIGDDINYDAQLCIKYNQLLQILKLRYSLWSWHLLTQNKLYLTWKKIFKKESYEFSIFEK